MNGSLKTILIAAFCALLAGGVVAFATQTNYLGTVFIADPTTLSQQLKVNSDGSINVNSTGGGGGTVTANQGTAAAITAGWPVTDGAGSDTTGSFTGTGAATVNAAIDGYGSAKIQIKGTYAGFTVNTLASSDGGVTFVPLQCAAGDGSQFGTTFVLTANQSIELACGHQSGDDTLQLQTSAGPATGTANVDISPSSFPSDDGNTTASSVNFWANVLLGAPSNYGTSPGAVKVPGVNAAVTQSALPSNAAQETGGNLASVVTNTGTTNTNLGAPGATACSTDTASCSLNALLQRIAQRISSLITALGSPFQAGGSLGAGSAIIGKVGIDQTTDGTTNAVSAHGAVNVTPTDCSGTITTGGTAQNAIAANAALHGFTIANIDASAGSGEPIWESLTTTAAASTVGSYPLAAPTATTFSGLSSYTTPLGFGTNHAVSVVAATTGHKFSCTYW